MSKVWRRLSKKVVIKLTKKCLNLKLEGKGGYILSQNSKFYLLDLQEGVRTIFTLLTGKFGKRFRRRDEL